MKIFHQNGNGLFRKLSHIKILLQETQKEIQILGITETPLSDFNTSQLDVEGYDFIRKDRDRGLGGGIGCYIRKDLNWHRRTDLEDKNVEAIWIEVYIKNSGSLLLCIMYRPPDPQNIFIIILKKTLITF